MCKRKPDKGFASVEEMISTFFHPPGGAKGYLARVSRERGASDKRPSRLCLYLMCASHVLSIISCPSYIGGN